MSDIDNVGVFMLIDRELYWYDFQNKILSSTLHTMGNGMASSQMECDATECFFENFPISGSSDETVYRIPNDGTGSATFLTTVMGGYGSSYSSAVTPNYIYVAKGSDNELISIARSDGAISSVDSNVDFILHADQNLYYNRGGTAVVQSEDGVIPATGLHSCGNPLSKTRPSLFCCLVPCRPP